MINKSFREKRLRLLAVIGRPIFFSRSPELYQAAFRCLKIEADYIRIASNSLEDAWQTIIEAGVSGFNLTSPYKEKILPYLDELDEQARAVAAVNMVLRQGNKFKGYNTDIDGFNFALRAAGLRLDNQRLLVLGAGGASRAVLLALKQAGVNSLWVANRDENKGKEQAQKFGAGFLPSAEIPKKIACFDLVISCLPRTEYLLPSSHLPAHVRLCEAAYNHYSWRPVQGNRNHRNNKNNKNNNENNKNNRNKLSLRAQTKKVEKLQFNSGPGEGQQLSKLLSRDERAERQADLNSIMSRQEADWGRLAALSQNQEFGMNPPEFCFGLEWLLGQGVANLRLFTGKELSEQEVAGLRKAVYGPRSRRANIALIGFMGCGKTSLGRLLAARLNFGFIDTDELIEKHAGKPIASIFAEEGEAVFRQLEASLISELLKNSRQTVLALGGGAVKEERVREALRSRCHVVWVWSPLATSLNRTTGSNRPLLALNNSPSAIEKLWQERQQLYAGCCDLLVSNRDGKLDETARLIHEEINFSL